MTETSRDPAARRTAFLARRRRLGPVRMDELFAPGYDTRWGHVNPSHRDFVHRLIEATPPGGLLLDAACGTGKYWPQIHAAGRRVVGADRSAGMLAAARRKHPTVEVHLLPLERLRGAGDLAGRFDGVLCVDAMENVPPEDWPAVLAGFTWVAKTAAPVYLTVEIPEDDDRWAAVHPVPPLVPGGVLTPGEHGGGYHHFPGQDRVARWLAEAGLEPVSTAEGDGYRHVLARLCEDGQPDASGR